MHFASSAPSPDSAAQLVRSLKLHKAMQTGDALGFNAAPGNAFPLKPESLDKTLYNTSYTMDDIQLFRMMPRNPVENSINQHNELQAYSENPYGGFFPEGGAPAQDSATFVRRTNQIKYLGVARGITHQLSLQNTLDQSALSIETQAGTMDLVGKIEKNLYHADSSLSPLQYDGLFAQVREKSPLSNTIDLHGAAFTEDVIINAATNIRSDPNYGKLTHIFSSIGIKGDIQRTFIPRTRILGMSTENDGVLRTGIRAIETPAGDLDLVGTTMMTRVGQMPTGARGPALAIPGTPTVSNVTTPAVSYSNYRASDAGAYRVWVVAWNDVGCSAPVAVGSGAINVPAGGSISFTVTPGVGNSTGWYEVWKTPVDGAAGTQSIVLRSPNTDPVTHIANQQPTTIVEFNDEMAGTEKALGLQMDKETLCLDVLAGMLRLAQPIVGTTLPFLLLSYHAPVLKAPRRIVVFKNIGRLPPQTQLA